MVKNEAEEVNLLDVLAGSFATLRKNLVLSILLPLLGVASGVFYYFSSSDVWESSAMFETSLLTREEGEFLFAQLGKVKKIPGLSPEQQKSVRQLKFKTIVDKDQPGGLNEPGIYLQITARVRNKEVFPALQKALSDIINNMPSVVRHRKERQRFYEQLIAQIDKEIAAMEKVKAQVLSQTQATFLNPALLYAETIDLLREKANLQIRLQDIETVHLVKGFDSLDFDRKTPLAVLGLVGLLIGVILLCVTLFIKFFLSYFRVYQSTH